jgi:hypothetical protein
LLTLALALDSKSSKRCSKDNVAALFEEPQWWQ